MNTLLKILLIISVLLATVMFLGGDPSSARGIYYVLWLSFSAVVWKKQNYVIPYLKRSALSNGTLFIGLGIIMIIVEETFAGIAVHLLAVDSLGELLLRIPPYYMNNLLLLPGFIVAWYLLLRRYDYSHTEVFTLVGLFGLFAEKIYIHVFTFPLIGLTLILPTMFTYMGIIAPSLFSLRTSGTKKLNRVARYGIGLVFPILVSVPFLLIHALLSAKGIIDQTILVQ